MYKECVYSWTRSKTIRKRSNLLDDNAIVASNKDIESAPRKITNAQFYVALLELSVDAVHTTVYYAHATHC